MSMPSRLRSPFVVALAITLLAGSAIVWRGWRHSEAPATGRSIETAPTTVPAVSRDIVDIPAPPRPVPSRPSPPATSAVARLLAAGDVSSRYEAYKLISKCVQLRYMEQLIAQSPIDQQADLRRPMERSAHDCDHVTASDVAHRMTYLQDAVRARLPGAAVAYMNEGFNGDLSALLTRPDDPLVVAWRSEVMANLRDAAASGDASAMLTLASILDEKTSLYGYDPAEAIKYWTAVGELHRLRDGSGNPNIGLIVARLSKSMSPEQAASAVQEGKALVDHCCHP